MLDNAGIYEPLESMLTTSGILSDLSKGLVMSAYNVSFSHADSSIQTGRGNLTLSGIHKSGTVVKWRRDNLTPYNYYAFLLNAGSADLVSSLTDQVQTFDNNYCFSGGVNPNIKNIEFAVLEFDRNAFTVKEEFRTELEFAGSSAITYFYMKTYKVHTDFGMSLNASTSCGSPVNTGPVDMYYAQPAIEGTVAVKSKSFGLSGGSDYWDFRLKGTGLESMSWRK